MGRNSLSLNFCALSAAKGMNLKMKKKLFMAVALILLITASTYFTFNSQHTNADIPEKKAEFFEEQRNKNIDIKKAQELVNFKVKNFEKLPEGFIREQIDAHVPPTKSVKELEIRKKMTRVKTWYKGGNKTYILFEQTGHKMEPAQSADKGDLDIQSFIVNEKEIFTYNCNCENTNVNKQIYYWYEDDNSFFVDFYGDVSKKQIDKILEKLTSN